MISLLLTLFISLFSICPTYNKLEQLENNVIQVDTDLKPKEVIHNEEGGYYVATSVDLQSTYFLWMTYYRLGGSLGTGDYMFDYSFQCYATSFAGFNMSSPYESTNVTYLNALSLTCLQFSYTESAKQISNYSVTLYYDNNGTETPYISFVYSYVYPNIDSLNISGNEGSIFIEYEWTNKFFYWPDSQQFYRTTSYFYDVDSYNTAYNEGYSTGYENGTRDGYQNGYSTGYIDGTDVDETASTIFTGILDVALIPVNVFLTIFNFEVFGINIGGIVSGLLTLSVVIIILRFLFGGKKDD